jgi:regulator of sirC expression with transglutaminase-like and TPR domain
MTDDGAEKAVNSKDVRIRKLFEAEVVRADQDVNLGRAALLVAQEEYPQMPVERYLSRLDMLAEEVQDRLNGESAPPIVLQALLDVLYDRHSFRGNRDVYYDPRNSLLCDVMDRGLGIPLTLGIVLLEVGWRLDLPLVGVNFPGHFLVRFEGEEIRLLVDPFDSGKIHFHEDAQSLLDRVYGGMVRLQPSFLRQASRREMLVRLLTNMKSLYLNVRDDTRALAVVERLLLIHPLAPGEIRDRGTLLARLGRTAEAVEQLEAYLEFSPRATDANRIRTLLERLREEPEADRRSKKRPTTKAAPATDGAKAKPEEASKNPSTTKSKKGPAVEAARKSSPGKKARKRPDPRSEGGPDREERGGGGKRDDDHRDAAGGSRDEDG